VGNQLIRFAIRVAKAGNAVERVDAGEEARVWRIGPWKDDPTEEPRSASDCLHDRIAQAEEEVLESNEAGCRKFSKTD
jgi:hypothetical protein